MLKYWPTTREYRLIQLYIKGYSTLQGKGITLHNYKSKNQCGLIWPTQKKDVNKKFKKNEISHIYA